MRYKYILIIAALIMLAGVHSVTAQKVPALIRIGLAVDQPEIQLTLDGSEKLFDISGNQPQEVSFSGDHLIWTSSGETLFINNIPAGKGPFSLVPGSSPLVWKSRSYRGEFVVTGKNGKLTLINRLPLEDYLRGVLPKEVSPEWPLAALKAQAITARTYTIVSLNRHGSANFDLCDTVHCQVYGGASCEKGSTDQALAQTAGQILTYKGKPISAYYHSTAGGMTASSANVWGSAIPYLKSVPDWDQNSPWYEWLKVFRWPELQAAAVAAYPKIGRLYRIVPIAFGNEGKLERITLTGDIGEVTLSGEQFRLWIGLPSSRLQMGVIYGPDPKITLWWVHNSPTPEAMVASKEIPGLTAELINPPWDLLDPYQWLQDKEPLQAVFRGSGWGHGVGLSQWGAKGMAEAGYNEQQILKHYFPGTEIGKVE